MRCRAGASDLQKRQFSAKGELVRRGLMAWNAYRPTQLMCVITQVIPTLGGGGRHKGALRERVRARFAGGGKREASVREWWGKS